MTLNDVTTADARYLCCSWVSCITTREIARMRRGNACDRTWLSVCLSVRRSVMLQLTKTG